MVCNKGLLKPLLFAVVSSEARNGLPSELLHASDLVLIVPTIEQLGRCVVEWLVIRRDKGLEVNSGRYKVMVGSSGGWMIVNYGKRSCGVVVSCYSNS